MSINGYLLLNVGPKGDGSIPDRDREILLEIGEWMKKNKEAVYGSKPWKICGEGSVNVAEGHFSDNEEPPYTEEDFRFVSRGSSIYAFAMRFPEDGNVTIKSLGLPKEKYAPLFHGLIQEVSILGYDVPVTWNIDDEGMHIRAGAIDTNMPVTIKIRTK